MLRLHLTGQDLTRTVIRDSPSVLVELLAAGKRMVQDVPRQSFGTWTAGTRAALRPVMRPYLDLCVAPKWSPDFLTPPDYGMDLGAGLDQVSATPPAVLEAELAPRIRTADLPSRVAPLAAGRRAAIAALRDAMIAFHEVAVAPYWPSITAAVRTDRASRAGSMADAGIEDVLRDLSPYLRWESSTLSYDCPGGADIDIEAAGRGVTLVPSYFQNQPSFCEHPGAPVALVYPVQRPAGVLDPAPTLGELLGRTRAAVLAATNGGRSTTEVAQAVGISLASASQHTAVLRAAGLITTHRTGAAVRHSMTPLGRSLMELSAVAAG